MLGWFRELTGASSEQPEFGGANGCGTVFMITLTGALTTLHSFNGTDDGFAATSLVQGRDGVLYGTTQGGIGVNGGRGGATDHGTVSQHHAKRKVDRVARTLKGYRRSNPLDLSRQRWRLLRSYVNWRHFGFGTIFKMAATGVVTTLHSFRGRVGERLSTVGPESWKRRRILRHYRRCGRTSCRYGIQVRFVG